MTSKDDSRGLVSLSSFVHVVFPEKENNENGDILFIKNAGVGCRKNNIVQIQKEVISDLKREILFLSKEIWESILLISSERSVNRFKNWIYRRMA